MSDDRLVFALEVQDPDAAPGHPKLRDEARGLQKQLIREHDCDPAESEDTVRGLKGDAATILVALGSSGAFTAIVTAIRLFVRNNPKRSVVLTRGADGSRTMTVDESNVENETDLAKLAEAFFKHG